MGVLSLLLIISALLITFAKSRKNEIIRMNVSSYEVLTKNYSTKNNMLE